MKIELLESDDLQPDVGDLIVLTDGTVWRLIFISPEIESPLKQAYYGILCPYSGIIVILQTDLANVLYDLKESRGKGIKRIVKNSRLKMIEEE